MSKLLLFLDLGSVSGLEISSLCGFKHFRLLNTGDARHTCRRRHPLPKHTFLKPEPVNPETPNPLNPPLKYQYHLVY